MNIMTLYVLIIIFFIYLVGSIISTIMARELNKYIKNDHSMYTSMKDFPIIFFTSWLSFTIITIFYIYKRLNFKQWLEQ